jgi:hypothetical protein
MLDRRVSPPYSADIEESRHFMTPPFVAPRSISMNLIQEDLARAHIDARLEQARALRRGHHLVRSARLTRRAERASRKAELMLTRLR